MKRNLERVLIFIYIGMVILCAYLNLSSENQMQITDLLVNVGLFAIVGAIFWHALKCFKAVNKIVKSLNRASAQIRDDFESVQVFLWDTYKDQESIFEDEVLSTKYKEYQYEMKRLTILSENGYKCSIEDYINRDIIDNTIERNIMNLVAGIMTGLGILGTFIGLSFGLQSFSTGTADEISNSIGPLMDGIKVAFHTSIYGMVFSLCFNYVYKKKLDEANTAMDYFLEIYKRYVIPNTQNDSINMLLMYQKQQADNMSGMVDTIGEQLAQKISETMSPHFERMNETIANFANVASQSQVEGIGTLVDKFVLEMNQSLGDNFKELGKVIEETCDWQKQNGAYMQEILEKVGDMTHNIQEINELSGRTVESLASYVEQIEKLQSIINENFMSVNLQMEANTQMLEKQHGYIDILVAYEKNISESSNQFTKDMVEQIEILQRMENEIANSTRENVEAITKKAEECSKAIADAAKQQIQDILNLSNSATGDMDRAAQELARVSQQLNGQLLNSLNTTFDTFDKKLAEITRHLSGTIAEVDSTTERVPQVVSAAYEGMEKSLTKMQDDLETLVHSMDILRRNTSSAIRLFEKNE